MTDFHSSASWPEDFSGRVRLFPLPNLVLFPQVVQPLHIFEPRYCQMLEEALASDQLIAMALLREGWESAYKGQPPVADTVCVGKIMSHAPTDDGRHNILLVGMKRAQILTELDSEQSFRTAEVSLIEDLYPTEEAIHRPELTLRLQELFSKFIPDVFEAQQSYQELVSKQLPLGTLTDAIAYMVDLPVEIKQQLLAEQNVDSRCRILTRCLEQKLAKDANTTVSAKGSFPPPFSEN